MTSKIKAYDVNGIQINVGDPVMCVGDAYWLTAGKTYTVESISESGEFVRVVGDNGLVVGWGGSSFRIDKTDIRNDIPEAFADDLVTAKWKYGYSDEKRTELLRVARMEGAHAVAVADGVTYSGAVSEVSEVSLDHIIIGGAGLTLPLWQIGWTITVTAPKPADPTDGDPVVLAVVIYPKKRVLFRAEDGNWSPFRGRAEGVWMTDDLSVIERLKPETIAELMGE